jgi:N-acetylneuraminic acid mutarotase
VRTVRAPLPEPRGASAAAVVDGRIVVVGGFGAGMEHSDSTVIYHPGADRWSHAAGTPTPRDHLAAVRLGGEVFAVGGRPIDADRNFDRLESHDLATGRWTTREPMPTRRGGLAAVEMDGRIHVFGGETTRRVFEEHEVYDSRSHTWTEVQPLPTPRHGLAAALLAGRIYLIGGGPRAGVAQTNVVEVFTP